MPGPGGRLRRDRPQETRGWREMSSPPRSVVSIMKKKASTQQGFAVAAADRDKALETALAQIERQFGKGSIMRLGDDERPPIESIPTGAIALDVALGIGGIPRGRIVEVYGPESSGKTTVALHAVASAQRLGGIAAFVDAEHALDPVYAKKIGVNTDDLLLSQPDTGEQALEIVDMLIRSGAVSIIVIDSVAALVPRAEIEGEMGDSHVGLQARLMSQALRKIAGALHQTNTTAIFINQLREKVGVMFGSPETTSGGRALKFYSSVRLDVRRIETLKDGTDAVGNRTRVKVVKNKVAPPFKQAEFDILYGVGVSREGGLIDLGVENGIVRKSGAWYTYEGTQLGQGKENARNFLRENADMSNEIEKRIKEKLGVPTGGDDSATSEPVKDAAAKDAAPTPPKRAVKKPAAEAKAASPSVPVAAGAAEAAKPTSADA
ncbi:protein RecA [Nocardiopsis ansamitocini]|uniref:Protein RecA n=1 Tax=Nocardiopsis ansamitocini TaxID=1670832 RepID=A0A9W6P356_9ACTN|nr:protein RecA [Nocardiopsis ansamitocini]